MANPPQAFLSFEKSYLVGIKILDDQHRQIVNLINDLYVWVITKKPADSPLPLLSDLANLAKTHFATEEQLLRAHSYPGYLPHKAAHEGLARNLMEYREGIARREHELTLDYVDLMKLWLLDHFAQFDREYAEFFAREGHSGERDSNQERAASPVITPKP